MADAAGDAPLLLVQADPESYLLPEPAFRLLRGLSRSEEMDLLLPVSNEPWTEEARSAPPFAYATPRLLEEAARFLAANAPPLRPAASPRSPVFAVKRAVLASFPATLPLDEVPAEARERGHRAWIDPGAYLHRYGEMDGQAREDLASRIPGNARSVLDVGCSRGATAPALRARGVAKIVGFEPDPEDAAAAALLYNRVLPLPLGKIAEEFPGEFDAILFGDVLEHLVDPSEALARVRPWLAPGGAVVASVPNLGHWAVIADLLEGRFDYVPYSILSGTHIRFFTRRTLCDVFEACGYRVLSVETVELPLSVEGEARLNRLASFPGASEDLSAAEFLVVASPDRPQEGTLADSLVARDKGNSFRPRRRRD